MALPTRKLGKHSPLEVSAEGLGCMSLTPGSFYDTAGLTEEQAAAVVHRAVELGVTLLNTSDLYGPYINEELLGRALEGHKDEVRIATKWGPMKTESGFHMDASPANCRACCEGALKRLGVPAIDLFTMRGPVDPKVPLEETMAEVKRLVEEGKVKHVGLSEVNSDDIRRAHAVVSITAVEQEWSLFTRDIEEDILPTCRELGIGILAYSPLGRGLLAGRFTSAADIGVDDFRRTMMPRFQGENFEKNLQLAQNVFRVAERKGCTPGQLALAWLLHKGDDVVPIPGTKTIKYLEENVGALKVKLSPEEMEELESLVPHDQVAGFRDAFKHATYHGSGKDGWQH
ncbi:hypothetical protein N2152v2_008525 [Parachlorella kessleri]